MGCWCAIMRRLLFLTAFLVTTCLRSWCSAAVIPPEWADVSINPCAKTSWQYLHWKGDGKCYQIFKQGFPCPPTQELVFDKKLKEAKCQCPSGRIYWEEDGRCYEPYAPGPCPEGSFLHPGQEVQARGIQRPDPHRRTLHQVQAWLGQQSDVIKMEPLGFPHCKQRGYCPSNWGFWPATELCYPFNTQGPCLSGFLFRWNSALGEAECGCQAHPTSSADNYWRPYYWPISATCHEHFTHGPCRLGEVFIYNQTAQATQCACTKNSPNYHAESGQCFEKYTRGPCGAGMWLVAHSKELPQYSMAASMRPFPADASPRPAKSRNKSGTRLSHGRRISTRTSLVCSCLPGFVYSNKEEQCFREFTQGPCRSGFFFARSDRDEAIGTCVKNPCGRHELFLPDTQTCHKIHTQGPCPSGQLILPDDQHGIGYRGRCGCSAANLQHYWPVDGKCYAHETPGPCDSSLVFSVRSGGGITPGCTCPEDHVYHNASGECYKTFSQGPCQWNEWLVPASAKPTDKETNDVRSDAELHSALGADGIEYVCRCKPGYEYQAGSPYCQPPSLELLFSLPKVDRGRRQFRQSAHRTRAPTIRRRRYE